MPAPTLLDIAKRNGSDAAVGLIDETIKVHPELLYVPSRAIKGNDYRTLIRTGLPTAGFRAANDGVDASKGTYENRLVETFILNPRWECDKAVADRSEDGAAAFIFDEATGIMEAALQSLCAQFYYGANNGGDATGHPGLIDSVNSDLVVDAGGTTADTGSSLWGVRFGRTHTTWVMGTNGALDMDDPRIETIIGENGKKLTGYTQELLAYPGLQVGSIYSIARIKRLTADSGKGLTDARIYALLATFPEGTRPDAMFCSGRSLEQLRASRTATNATGAPAPIPTEVSGVPIYATPAISNTESLSL